MTDERSDKVAMVIMAHPDDAEFGSAGTVAAWARAGWEVYYVVCTDASGGGLDDATDVGEAARQLIRDTRQREQRAAADILGVKRVIFLAYPDGILEPTLELRRDLVRLLRAYRPSRVICPCPDRVWTPVYHLHRHHPDHLACGQAALAAIYPASQNPWDFPELLSEGLLPHKVREIFVVGAPVTNYPVDITDTIDVKLRALHAHASQVADHWERTEQMMRGWAADRGARHGFAYAEEFHRIENT